MLRTPSHAAFRWILAALVLGAPACTKKSVVAPTLEPSCLVSPTTLSFGVARVGDSAGAKSFTITNDGEGILSGTVADSCGPFIVTSGSGPIRLGPGLSKSVVVVFRPAAAGVASCELALGGNVRCTAINCSGTGTPRAPVCVLTPAALPFGEQPIGACSVPQSFTIANSGGDTLTGSVPASCGPFTVSSGSGPLRLAPGQSRTVAVRFCPTGAGPAGCDLSLGGNIACPALACTGTGTVLQPSCQVSPPALAFGAQTAGGCSSPQSFTITNGGNGTLVGTVPAACGPFTVTSGSGALSLAPGQSRSVTVVFCPTSQGPAACDLAFAGNVSCPAVGCSGTGTPGPACRVSPASLAFGTLNFGACSDTQSFTITNIGGGLLAGSVPASCGPYWVTTGVGPFSLPAGGSHQATVKFCPTGQGFASCDLTIGANAACTAIPCYGEAVCVDTVIVTSNPAGATIFVDGANTSEVTPHAFTLSQGYHSFRVKRNAVNYFAPRDTALNVPCRGTLTCKFLGHNLESYIADATTWIDQRAPTQNNCTSPDLFVGQDSLGGHTTGALIHLIVGVSATWPLFSATLAVHETDCGLATGALDVIAYPLDQEWSACAPTWAQPGVTWSTTAASPAVTLRCPTAWRLFDVSAVAAQWASGNRSPHGWILLPASPAKGLSVHRFDSVNAASSSYYPSLQLDYVAQ